MYVRAASGFNHCLAERFVYAKDDKLSCCLVQFEAEEAEADSITIRDNEDYKDPAGEAS